MAWQNLGKQSEDYNHEQGTITQRWVVESTTPLIDTLETCRTSSGIPVQGASVGYSITLPTGTVTTPRVSDVAITRSGDYEQIFEATVTFSNPSTTSNQNNAQAELLPWEQEATVDVSWQDEDVLAIYDRDGKQVTMSDGSSPLTPATRKARMMVITINRNVTDADHDSMEYSVTYHGRVNSASFTFLGQPFVANTVLCSYGFRRQRHYYTDGSGLPQDKIYYAETITLLAKMEGDWADIFLDESVTYLKNRGASQYRAFVSLRDENNRWFGYTPKVASPASLADYAFDKAAVRLRHTPMRLNGAGRPLLGEDIPTAGSPAGMAPVTESLADGIAFRTSNPSLFTCGPIETTKSTENAVILKYWFFERVAFSGMNLDLRINP